MSRRQPGKPDAIDASRHSRYVAIADSAWSAQDRVRSGSKGALKAAAEGSGAALERISYIVRARTIWPLEDRAEAMGARARSVSFGLVVLLAAAAGVAGLVWAAPDGPNRSASAPVAETTAPLAVAAAAPEKRPQPTLHGAAPVFRPSGREAAASEVDPAKAIVGSSSDSAAGSSSSPEAATSSEALAATSSGPKNPQLDGPPAGPKAIAVARDFADAFVLYETGGSDAGIRAAFAATATPALAKALLDRPPRLPASVKVPKAKVLNIVPAPSHASVFPLSVSLLRVGVTSELRLDMEWLKGERWRVTNVLG
jgi:hypothetical protein